MNRRHLVITREAAGLRRCLLVLLSFATIVVSSQAHAWETAPLNLKADDPLLQATDKKYAGNKQRVALHQRIINKALATGKAPSKRRRPILFLMGGGGASGKGYVKKMLIDDGVIDDEAAVQIDPDEVKAQLPEYQKLTALKDGRAAAVVHEESSQIAKAILAAAFERGFNVVHDVTLGDPGKGFAQIQDAKRRGYRVFLVGVTVDPQIAIDRATGRGKQTGRWVPVEMLLRAHRGFSVGFKQYVERVDKASLWDTSTGGSPQLIAQKGKDGRLKILSPERWAAFVGKSKLNIRSQGPKDLYQ